VALCRADAPDATVTVIVVVPKHELTRSVARGAEISEARSTELLPVFRRNRLSVKVLAQRIDPVQIWSSD
jgi:hypothetical protein